LAWLSDARPALIVHYGLSGSGKTTASQVILETIGALRVRSDIERKRLHGLTAGARTGSSIGGGIYDAEATGATYARLANALRGGGGYCLIDATFLLAPGTRFAPAQRLRAFGIAEFTAARECAAG
jgi:predicted kinase